MDSINDNIRNVIGNNIICNNNYPNNTFIKKIEASMMLNSYNDIVLSNSIKYTPVGGTITIGLSKNNLGAWLTITDTGIGIPLEDQRRIFDKGFTGYNGRVDTSHHSTG